MASIVGVPLVGILLLCAVYTATADGAQQLYKDPKQQIEARVEDLIRRMTLPEKVGQMMQLDRANINADIIKNYGIGSVLSTRESVPGVNATAKVWADMINQYQKAAMSSRLGIPLLYGIDGVHGIDDIHEATIFPHNIGLGVTRDPDLVKKIGAATALEARAAGIPYVFAPSLAVCRDPRWSRCYQSYSEDPKIVQQMTTFVSGLQGDLPANYKPKGYPYIGDKTKVVGCAKHFLGDGMMVEGANDKKITNIDYQAMFKIHVPAFVDSINKGVGSIMLSSSSWQGKKIHEDYDLVTTYLKNQLGFKGFVISDWQGIDRITNPPHSNYTYSLQASINAGVDMVVVPHDYNSFSDTLMDLVEKNVVPIARVEDAVRRILRVKFAAGLFENPYPDVSLAGQVGSKDHRELAREAVRKSLVLLKNGDDPKMPLLPLEKKAIHVLVAGPHADNIALQSGQPGNKIIVGTTILDAIKATVANTTKVTYEKNPSAEFIKSKEFDYAIVVVGENPNEVGTNGENNMDLGMQWEGIEAIKNVCNDVRCVLVLVSGRPLQIYKTVQEVDALVAAWLPGTEGQGVADVLFGDYPFTGKLARTWFQSLEQVPMNVGDPNYDPLFAFGFGLETKLAKSQ